MAPTFIQDSPYEQAHRDEAAGRQRHGVLASIGAIYSGHVRIQCCGQLGFKEIRLRHGRMCYIFDTLGNCLILWLRALLGPFQNAAADGRALSLRACTFPALFRSLGEVIACHHLEVPTLFLNIATVLPRSLPGAMTSLGKSRDLKHEHSVNRCKVFHAEYMLSPDRVHSTHMMSLAGVLSMCV